MMADLGSRIETNSRLPVSHVGGTELTSEDPSSYFEPQQSMSESDESLSLLNAILSESPVGLAFLDTSMRFRRVNDTFAELAGLPVAEHIGKTISAVIPDIDPDIETLLERMLEGQQAACEREVYQDPSRSATGQERHWVAHYYPVRAMSGDIIGVGAIFVDVTERQLANEARQRSESQLRLALDATRMGLWFWDIDSGEMRWSQTNALLLGLNPLDTPSIEVFERSLHQEDRERVRSAMDQSASSGDPFEETFRVIWPDGTVHWILSKGQAQYEDSHISELVGVHVDITESRAAQDERARLALRQTRAGEQAVRMQRVTAALSEAVTVSQVCDVILHEGCAVLGAPRGTVALLSEDRQVVETMRMFGYESANAAIADVQLDAETPIADTLRTGNTVLLTDFSDIAASYPDVDATISDGSTQAIASLPLAVRDVVHGAWLLTWPEERVFEEGEIIILLTLAAQAGQALERARLYERERLIATSLQRTLLPARLPTLPGASTARRYLPSGPGVEVGGDWYDVLRLPDHRVVLVIGDVGGHNIDAAAIMGQLRNAVRSYAWEGHSASMVLEMTNRLLCGLEPGVLATCCYIELNLDDGIAAVARAGHPQPLIIDEERAFFADIPADPPLGTEVQQKFEQSTLFLSTGSTIVLYTDGLIETRSLSLGQGLQRLLNAANTINEEQRNGSRDLDPETVADYLLRSMTQQREREDDVAILVLRYEPAHTIVTHAGPKVIRRHLPSSATSAGVARRFAADVMNDWGAPDLADMVSLCVSELVTNALIHTATDVELVLRLSPASVRVEVVDHSDRMPVLRQSHQDDTSGRGLHIVEAVSSDWGVEPYRSGKSVWFQIDRRVPQLS